MKPKNNHKTNKTQSNYILRVLNFVLILSFFLSNYQVKAQQKMPLPQNAQLKTFSNEHYSIIGYVADDKFIEGQKITFEIGEGPKGPVAKNVIALD